MIDFVSKNRVFLMGIAMLFVLVYHAFSWVYNPVGSLNIGYVGVDIFFFLSGFGLTRSFEKNGIKQFYKNRLIRVFPAYFLAVIATYLIFSHKTWGGDDLFYNLLCVGFYTKGGAQRYDWYLESLFTIYFLFPVFYHLSRLKYLALLLLFIATAIVLFFFKVPWWYDCLIARFPIFLYGVIFSKCDKYQNCVRGLGILLYVPCRLFISPFLASSLLVSASIYSASILADRLKPSMKNVIDFLGKYTLEIYIANLFIYWSVNTYTFTIIEGVFLYIFVQIFGSYLVIQVNRYIATLWSK